jgi:hypothetical protein
VRYRTENCDTKIVRNISVVIVSPARATDLADISSSILSVKWNSECFNETLILSQHANQRRIKYINFGESSSSSSSSSYGIIFCVFYPMYLLFYDVDVQPSHQSFGSRPNDLRIFGLPIFCDFCKPIIIHPVFT